MRRQELLLSKRLSWSKSLMIIFWMEGEKNDECIDRKWHQVFCTNRVWPPRPNMKQIEEHMKRFESSPVINGCKRRRQMLLGALHLIYGRRVDVLLSFSDWLMVAGWQLLSRPPWFVAFVKSPQLRGHDLFFLLSLPHSHFLDRTEQNSPVSLSYNQKRFWHELKIAPKTFLLAISFYYFVLGGRGP